MRMLPKKLDLYRPAPIIFLILVKMVKIGSFWGQNDVTGQNLGKLVKKFSLKVSKNYFSQVYGHKFGLNCH